MHLPALTLLASTLLLTSTTALPTSPPAHHPIQRSNPLHPRAQQPSSSSSDPADPKPALSASSPVNNDDPTTKAPYLTHLSTKPSGWLFIADSRDAGYAWQKKYMLEELDRYIAFYQGRREKPPVRGTVTPKEGGWALTFDLEGARPLAVQVPLPTTMGLFVAALVEVRAVVERGGIREMAVLVGDEIDGGGLLKIVRKVGGEGDGGKGGEGTTFA